MRYRIGILLFSFSVLLAGCSHEELSDSGDINDIALDAVLFPDPPIEIMNNVEHGMMLINYFNIIHKNDMYYMYYAGFVKGGGRSEYDQNLYLATSSDGIHYNDYVSNNGSRIIMPSLKEQSVFLITGGGKIGLVGNVEEKGIEKLCVWESEDGIQFDNRKVLFADIPHDTQNVLISRKDGYDLYTRLWLPDWDHRTNRKIAKCSFDKDFAKKQRLIFWQWIINIQMLHVKSMSGMICSFPLFSIIWKVVV